MTKQQLPINEQKTDVRMLVIGVCDLVIPTGGRL
jgi:hypothetical protein